MKKKKKKRLPPSKQKRAQRYRFYQKLPQELKCSMKRRYDTVEQAGINWDFHPNAWPYVCPHCDGIHFTMTPPKSVDFDDMIAAVQLRWLEEQGGCTTTPPVVQLDHGQTVSSGPDGGGNDDQIFLGRT